MGKFVFFSEQFIRSLPLDRFGSILAIVTAFRRMLRETPGDQKRYQMAQEACAILAGYLQREGFAITVPRLGPEYDVLDRQARLEKVSQVSKFMDELETDIKAQDHIDRFDLLLRESSALMGEDVCYDFSDEELGRIRKSLNEIKQLVLAGASLKPVHASRLVKSADRLDADLRLKTCDLSHFWGFIAEASLALRLAAKDVRPITDEVDKLVKIVWPIQAKAFGLPADTPFRLLDQDT